METLFPLPGQVTPITARYVGSLQPKPRVFSHQRDAIQIGSSVGMTMKEVLVDEAYLSEVERRVKAATTGPWISFIEGRDNVSGSSFIRTASDDLELSGATDADQDFIAHARQDVALLLAEVRRLRRLAGLG